MVMPLVSRVVITGTALLAITALFYWEQTMYYYQHHVGDYRRDTAHLSLLEHGIYRQLLDLYYITEKPLDESSIRLINARTQEEKDATMVILGEFFVKKGKKYYHKRCDEEIAKFKTKSNIASTNANKRWNKNSNLHDANALPTQSERNANHKPITNNQKPYTASWRSDNNLLLEKAKSLKVHTTGKSASEIIAAIDKIERRV